MTCTYFLLCSLLDDLSLEAATSSKESYISRVWTCPLCQMKLAVNLAEQLQHQASCKKEVEEALSKSTPSTSTSQDPALLKDYHCAQCGETLRLTAVDILKHKRDHARTSAA